MTTKAIHQQSHVDLLLAYIFSQNAKVCQYSHENWHILPLQNSYFDASVIFTTPAQPVPKISPKLHPRVKKWQFLERAIQWNNSNNYNGISLIILSFPFSSWFVCQKTSWLTLKRKAVDTMIHIEAEWCICVSKLTIIGSDNKLSPGRCQAIICTNAGIVLIGPLGTNLREILIEIHAFSLKCIWKSRLQHGDHFVLAPMFKKTISAYSADVAWGIAKPMDSFCSLSELYWMDVPFCSDGIHSAKMAQDQRK